MNDDSLIDKEFAKTFIVEDMSIEEFERLCNMFKTREAAGLAVGFKQSSAARHIRKNLDGSRQITGGVATMMRLATGTHETFELVKRKEN